MSSRTHTAQGNPDFAFDTMLNVRIPAEHKRRLAVEAAANGESLSDLCRRLLALNVDTKGAQA